MVDIKKSLQKLSSPPSDPATFEAWLDMSDAISYLASGIGDDETVLYAGMDNVFINVVLVPKVHVEPPDLDDLMEWDTNTSSQWSACEHWSSEKTFGICEPMSSSRSKTLGHGEQLVFARRFEGHSGSKTYYELLQKFAHVCGLHFMPERNAYCRIDGNGDVEEVVRIIRPANENGGGGTIVAVKSGVLLDYAALSGKAIVRTFDFTRFRPERFSGWQTDNIREVRDADLCYKIHVEPGHAGYMRGVQVVRPMSSPEESYAKITSGPSDGEREYASFIVYDFRHDEVKELSTAPGETANYHIESDLPFEMSPAFFRPEVLLKYKADREKYRIETRSISCRDTWFMKSYDVNEAGQIHAYLVYLRDLPYAEQLYWRSFNERPKGPISKRAFTNDFQGKWDFEYEPVGSLKEVVRELSEGQVGWWKVRTDDSASQLVRPVTESVDEWADEILRLDQLIVEGFEKSDLVTRLQGKGITPDPAHQSLKLVEDLLMATGYEKSDAVSVVSSLYEIHFLRNKLKGHASASEAGEIRRQIISKHGSYKNHFLNLCQRCDETMRTLKSAFASKSDAGIRLPEVDFSGESAS